MKTLLIVSLFLVSGIVLSLENHEDHSKMDHSKMDHLNDGHDLNKGNKHFNQVLKNYEDLHQAFFDNDNQKVKTNAAKVAKSIEQIKDDEIAKSLSFTVKKLNEVAVNDDLEANKSAFGTISHALLIVLEKYAPNKSYQGYYCPMIKKFWIQNTSKSKNVFNPYESKTMPTCGEPKTMNL